MGYRFLFGCFFIKDRGEQLIKLMTLGLTEAEAEEQIISGFLK